MGQNVSTSVVPPVDTFTDLEIQPVPVRRRAPIWRRKTAITSVSKKARYSQDERQSRLPASERFSQMLQQITPISAADVEDGNSEEEQRHARPSFVSRLSSRTRTSAIFSSMSRARNNIQDNERSSDLWPIDQAEINETERADSTEQSISLPRLQIPGLELDFQSPSRPSSANETSITPHRRSSRRSSLRIPNGLTDRLSSIRSGRSPINSATSNSRRNRGAANQTGEDNTVLLSRLLSVAATATAATLLEGSGQTMAEARGTASDGDDGSFDGFLRSLEHGRLAAALRAGASSSGNSAHSPLNFFRMFRFEPLTPRNATEQTATPRMVPIIIVGIRSVAPNTTAETADLTGVPPFLDALSTLPATPLNSTTLGNDIMARLRSGSSNTSTSTRRRTSIGSLSTSSLGFDALRRPRSRHTSRPESIVSEASLWPSAPPASPVNPESAVSLNDDGISSATAAVSRSSSFSHPPRRESLLRARPVASSESAGSPASTTAARAGRASGAAHRSSSAFASRRNGIVESDDGHALSTTTPTSSPVVLGSETAGNPTTPETTRSWIIYVLGGSYPENHPILTTPSLFTDSPTYEDMMLLSSLIGPAKPPVATDSDIEKAGGLYRVQTGMDSLQKQSLVAVSQDCQDDISLVAEQRCLVCLCDFENHDEVRRLGGCGHLYHRECIDEWLTKGRNSCPLCRGQGVEESKQDESSPRPVDSMFSSPIIPNETATS